MIRAFGVVVPAHNEELLLARCLQGLTTAAIQGGVPQVRIVVVADACGDGTVDVARSNGAEVLEVDLRSAGAARFAGFELIVGESDVAVEEHWLCTTDADSVVPNHWFLHQAQKEALGYDAVVGTVMVDDWSEHSSCTARRFERHYGSGTDGHPHVHGANLGLSGSAYATIGGFPPLALAEDHALVAALTQFHLRICRTGNAPVLTSARRDARAPDGFAALLEAMDSPLWDHELREHS
jgi:glycosyltransferase involved in cell wall biosynthesis